MHMVKPYYESGGITIYHGDCRDVLPQLGPVDLVLTDPPYGVGWNTDGTSRGGQNFPRIVGDDLPFDPSHLIHFPRLVLFGANHYADRLPPSPSWICWDKRLHVASNDQADCEMAWTNLGGPARMFRLVWNGGATGIRDNPWARPNRKGGPNPPVRMHPTQKPLALFRWIIEGRTEPGEIILDPYLGCGTTTTAAKELGRRAIGIEIEERYCEIAAKRLSQEVMVLT